MRRALLERDQLESVGLVVAKSIARTDTNHGKCEDTKSELFATCGVRVRA